MSRLILGLIFLVVGLVAAPAATPSSKSEKVLIVYLSRTENTQVLAEIIHSYVGGTLVQLELKKPYPEAYDQIVQQVARENDTGFLPALKTEIKDIAQYDLIFVGFPTWGMQLPPPIKSFLRQYDLTEKVIVPFNSNGGYGLGSSFQTIRELCPKSRIAEGYSVKGGNEKEGIHLSIRDERADQVREEIGGWLKRTALID